MDNAPIALVAAAAHLPPRKTSLEDIFAAEGLVLDDGGRARLGVESLHVFEGESPTEMAVAASRAALAEAGLEPADLHAIVDFSVMPQRYVEPAWSMSNELQHELGARSAFTLGYSGGGTANLHVALKFAAALMAADADVRTVLLAASDRALPGNRLVNPDDPATVIGDGASALVLARGGKGPRLAAVHVASDGARHDVLCIPGGGMRFPTRLDLHRLTIRGEADRMAANASLALAAAERAIASCGKSSAGTTRILGANHSAADIAAFEQAGGDPSVGRAVLRRCGHLHASDFVLNYLALRTAGIGPGDRVVLAAHGLGFTSGAAVLVH